MPDAYNAAPPNPPADVAAAFGAIAPAPRAHLIHVRQVIFDEAATGAGVGVLVETLKWGQPSYLTERPKSGTTIRLGCLRAGDPALFVHCQTTLIPDFEGQFPGVLQCEGRRAVILPADGGALRLLIGRALRYHLK